MCTDSHSLLTLIFTRAAAMATISALPPEILVNVFEYLWEEWPGDGWLAPIAAVCRNWRPLAQSVEFREVTAFTVDELRRVIPHAKHIHKLAFPFRSEWHDLEKAECLGCFELSEIFSLLAALERAGKPTLRVTLQLDVQAHDFYEPEEEYGTEDPAGLEEDGGLVPRSPLDGPRSKCPFYDCNASNSTLSHLPKLQKVEHFTINLAGNMSEYNNGLAWFIVSLMTNVTGVAVSMGQRSPTNPGARRSESIFVLPSKLALFAFLKTTVHILTAVAAVDFGENIHLLPTSIRTIAIDHVDASLSRAQHLSHVAYGLVKRPGLVELEWIGGLDDSAFGPDYDSPDDDDALAASSLHRLSLLLNLGSYSFANNEDLTPSQCAAVEKMLLKAAKLLSRLPRPLHLTVTVPMSGDRDLCDYRPGTIRFCRSSEHYRPSTKVLNAFLEDTKRHSGKDAEMVFRIGRGGGVVESTLQ